MSERTGDSPAEKKLLVDLAFGRIFRLGSRPTQPGDVAEYERCRAIILDNTEPTPLGWQPNYARDRRAGAAGD